MATHEEELRTNFTGDADGLIREAKRAGDAYEDTEKDIKDLGRQAELTDADIDAMADALSDSIRDSERARDSLEKMRAEIKRLGDAAPDSMDNVGRSMRDTADTAAEAGRETGQEFMSNLGEAVGSGDISGIVQGTLGGLVSSLSGPLGLAAAAVGGVVAIGFSQIQKHAEEVAALSESMLAGMRERFGLLQSEMTAAFKQEQLEQYIRDNIDTFQKLLPLVRTAGVDAHDYALAMFEGGEQADAVESELRNIMAVHGQLEGPVGRQKVVYDEIGQAASDTLKALQEQAKAQGDATREAEAFAEFTDQARTNVIHTKEELENLPDAHVKVYLENVETRGRYQYGSYGGNQPSDQAAGRAGGAAPPTGGQGAAYVTNNWHVTVNARTPDPTAVVRAIERYAKDNGRRDSVSVTV